MLKLARCGGCGIHIGGAALIHQSKRVSQHHQRFSGALANPAQEQGGSRDINRVAGVILHDRHCIGLAHSDGVSIAGLIQQRAYMEPLVLQGRRCSRACQT